MSSTARSMHLSISLCVPCRRHKAERDRWLTHWLSSYVDMLYTLGDGTAQRVRGSKRTGEQTGVWRCRGSSPATPIVARALPPTHRGMSLHRPLTTSSTRRMRRRRRRTPSSTPRIIVPQRRRGGDGWIAVILEAEACARTLPPRGGRRRPSGARVRGGVEGGRRPPREEGGRRPRLRVGRRRRRPPPRVEVLVGLKIS
jgi:hypothetical protein